MIQQPRASQRPSIRAGLCARGLLFLITVLVAVTNVGCGANEPSGPAVTYVISEDFGGHEIDQREISKLGKAPTIIRILQREFESVETSYGGRFVTKIAGKGAIADPPTDWIFYLNGRESQRGSADVELTPGDHIQWDLHRWDATQGLDRTVGAFPRPLVGDANSKPAVLVCPQEGKACGLARDLLKVAGVKFVEGVSTRSRNSIVVGNWRDVTNHDGVPDLSRGPDETGVFASFSTSAVTLWRGDGEPGIKFGAGSGIVAAVKRDDLLSTWIVTGVDDAGTERAARLLSRETLQNRFAVAANDESVASLPIVE